MGSGRTRLTVIEKEMGITHKDFYAELPNLLQNIPYQCAENTISFQLKQKPVEIILGPEGVRKLGQSLRLPATLVTLRFIDFSEAEVSDFIKDFNVKFMKGGG